MIISFPRREKQRYWKHIYIWHDTSLIKCYAVAVIKICSWYKNSKDIINIIIITIIIIAIFRIEIWYQKCMYMLKCTWPCYVLWYYKSYLCYNTDRVYIENGSTMYLSQLKGQSRRKNSKETDWNIYWYRHSMDGEIVKESTGKD